MALKLTPDMKAQLMASIEETKAFKNIAHVGSRTRLIPADAQPGYTTSGSLLTVTMSEKTDATGGVRTYKTGEVMHDITAYIDRDGETCALYLGDIEAANLNRASHRQCGVLPGDIITVTVSSLRHYTGRDGADRTAPVLRFSVRGPNMTLDERTDLYCGERTDPGAVWDALETAWAQSLDTTLYTSVEQVLRPVYGDTDTVTADDIFA